ncbi:WG repeat-containing protein [Crocinitomicaceae bacterium CZZ-1]|uniref:WG repeat-containing protein n=1 Tax=Taishania pollutisoli TaxID=2766479 RepID=A0A8J6PCY8_9FLAO|nr:WG repeat-containing protein [Taishania pollutisoli]MBC9810895.1 WG repeat-containing protein [Taishania pollutisoli]
MDFLLITGSANNLKKKEFVSLTTATILKMEKIEKRMDMKNKIVVVLLQLALLQSCGYGNPGKENGKPLHAPEQENTDNAPLAAYKHVYSFQEGFAIVSVDKKHGFIDKKGNNVIPCKYDYAHDFSNGFARIEQKGKYGFIDKSGKEITPAKYDFAADFQHGRALVKLDGKWGFIDKSGAEIIPVIYDDASDFSEELTTVKDNDRWFIIDTLNNRKPVSHNCTSLSSFHDGLASIEIAGKSGCINKQGKIVIPPTYTYVFFFNDSLAMVELNEQHGFINRKGKVVVPLLYDNFPHFSDGLAAVSLNDKYGFIDKTGKVVIPMQYSNVFSFYDGLAGVYIDGKIGCINKKGELVIPAVYDQIEAGEGVIGMIAGEKGQFFDLQGNVLFPEVYEDLYGFSDGAALVKQNGNWFFIDKQGRRLF